MRIHHIVALGANLGVAAIALTDAITVIATGSYSVFADDSGVPAAIVASALVHALAYASIFVVLVRERERFRAANRFARVLRGILLPCYAVLVAGVLLGTVVPADSGFGVVSGAVATIAFLLVMLVPAALGFALLRRNPLGIGARVLLATLPVAALVVALGFLAPAWAHPGWVEVVTGIGMSLLGVGATAVAPAPVVGDGVAPARV